MYNKTDITHGTSRAQTKTLLLNKLTNFLSNFPIWMDLSIDGDDIYLYFADRDYLLPKGAPDHLLYKIRYNLPVVENVFQIRKMLVDNWAPRLHSVTRTKRPATKQEIEEILGRGESVPMEGITEEEVQELFMSKIILRNATVVLSERNLRTGKKWFYTLKRPLEMILDKYQTMNAEEFYKFFLTKATLKKVEEFKIGE